MKGLLHRERPSIDDHQRFEVSDLLIARYARTAVLAQNGVCSPGLANSGSQFAGHRDEVTVADQSVVAASEHIVMGADSGPSPRREGPRPDSRRTSSGSPPP